MGNDISRELSHWYSNLPKELFRAGKKSSFRTGIGRCSRGMQPLLGLFEGTAAFTTVLHDGICVPRMIKVSFPVWSGLFIVLLSFLLAGFFNLALAAHPNAEKTAINITGEPRFIQKPENFNPSVSIATSIPSVDYLVYPTGGDMGNRDHWGTGIVHSNGKVYTAIGDHGGINANSYIYEYDPSTKRMRLVADLQEAVADFQSGDWGFGKVHGRLNEGSDGNIYFANSWGTNCWGSDAIECSKFKGDRIFHYDPRTETIHDYGITLPGHGTPGARLNVKDMLLYGLSFNFLDKPKKRFIVYDLESEELIFNEGGLSFPGKELCIDNEGNAYFHMQAGSLQKYSRQTNSISNFAGIIPSPLSVGFMRCTRPDAGGIMYGSSDETLFSLDPNTEEVRRVTSLLSGSRALALDPTNRYVYYLAGTRASGLIGVPVVQIDLYSGASQKVIAFLEDVFVNDFGYIPDVPKRRTLSMSLMVDNDGRTLYIMFNGRQQDIDKGNVAFAAVHIPDGEAVFPPTQVAIDIRPRTERNRINRRSRSRIRVAVLSDSEFDPLQIEIPTVRFGPDGAKALSYRVKDVNKDGLGDLMLRFKVSHTGIACNDTEATLTGKTYSGQKLTGTDTVKVLGCKEKKNKKNNN